MSEVVGLLTRLRAAMDVVYREVLKFGAVGLLAYAVDVYVYNLMRVGVWPLEEAPLGDKPLVSKIVSVSVATVVAWLGNRYWTFRHRRRATARREFVLFAVMNIGGLAISLGCLVFSHYVLGLTSALADNISGNLVGLGLGTLFRFWAYRQFVFTELQQEIPMDYSQHEHGTGHGTGQGVGQGAGHGRQEPQQPVAERVADRPAAQSAAPSSATTSATTSSATPSSATSSATASATSSATASATPSATASAATAPAPTAAGISAA